jgi:hypothetical protein
MQAPQPRQQPENEQDDGQRDQKRNPLGPARCIQVATRVVPHCTAIALGSASPYLLIGIGLLGHGPVAQRLEQELIMQVGDPPKSAALP